jgi:hypothetical protein
MSGLLYPMHEGCDGPLVPVHRLPGRRIREASACTRGGNRPTRLSSSKRRASPRPVSPGAVHRHRRPAVLPS